MRMDYDTPCIKYWIVEFSYKWDNTKDGLVLLFNHILYSISVIIVQTIYIERI